MEQKKRKREGGAKDTESGNKKVQRTFSQRANVNRQVNINMSGKEFMEKMDGNLKNVLGNLFSKK